MELKHFISLTPLRTMPGFDLIINRWNKAVTGVIIKHNREAYLHIAWPVRHGFFINAYKLYI
ncbi:MAG TPA: hypothetical protein VFW07_26645 [Parafilimonas sp.]|nr:hypothetical protein [Parafilimonas sp.]